MVVRVVHASIADVRADAICTSTNPRLSLFEGTGGAVSERGGWEIKRACEQILAEHERATGSPTLNVGAVRGTEPGRLPAKVVLHCVASDRAHRSSKEIVAACVGNAIAIARSHECSTVAMPVFATGHAAFRFETAVEAMAEALRDAPWKPDEVTIAVVDPDRVNDVRRILRGAGSLEVLEEESLP